MMAVLSSVFYSILFAPFILVYIQFIFKANICLILAIERIVFIRTLFDKMNIFFVIRK